MCVLSVCVSLWSGLVWSGALRTLHHFDDTPSLGTFLPVRRCVLAISLVPSPRVAKGSSATQSSTFGSLFASADSEKTSSWQSIVVHRRPKTQEMAEDHHTSPKPWGHPARRTFPLDDIEQQRAACIISMPQRHLSKWARPSFPELGGTVNQWQG